MNNYLIIIIELKKKYLNLYLYLGLKLFTSINFPF